MTSTAHIAKLAVAPKTGRFASLRGLLTGNGGGLSKISFNQAGQARSLVVLCALAGLFALATAAIAQAAPPGLISDGSFSAVTSYPSGIAVDQSSGDLYVAGLSSPSGAPVDDKLDASGKLISPPSPFGENFNAGAAVNPTNGDLYVLNLFGSINIYDPNSGALLSSFPVSVSGGIAERLLQIATDAAGDVYVPEPLQETGSGTAPNDEVHEYSPSGTLLNTFTGSGAGTLKEPTGVAVDSSGNLWVADRGDGRIEELSPADVPIDEIKSEGVSSVALDGHGEVFAIAKNERDSCGTFTPPCSHLIEYDSAGAQIADVGAGNFGSETGSLPDMVAVNESSGRVYVTDGSAQQTENKDLVWVFGAPIAPAVDNELTAEVSTSEAKLGALIDAGGIETSYRFEYGMTSAYGHSTPFPEGSVGEGISAHAVWAAASGLAPGTTYHYRVVASNELGTVAGPDQIFTTEAAVRAECPNEQLRVGFSAKLPDCRAYELATPPVKNSAEVESAGGTAAADGNAVWFLTSDPLPGATAGGDFYVATRGAGGWGSENILPLAAYSGIACIRADEAVGFSSDLSKAIVSVGLLSRASSGSSSAFNFYESCNAEGMQVVKGEPVGYLNLLLRDDATGSYRLINTPPAGVTPADAFFRGASADFSHVVFSESAPLAEGAQYGVENLYEWDEGTVRLLSVLPTGAPVAGESFASISAEGSHILFNYGGGMYDRIDGQRTVQVDESQGGSSSSGGGFLETVSAEGQKIIFTDEGRLTPDSTAEPGEPDLYECVLPEGASKCELSDLTVAKAGEHADVTHVDPLGSKEGSYVYFTARGVLASNTREFTDSRGNKIVEGAQSGQNNIYLSDGKTTTFIAIARPAPVAVDVDNGEGLVSPDGTWLAFTSTASLTGYENTKPDGIAAQEIFLYSMSSNQLVCVSCHPNGAAPEGDGGYDQSSPSDGGRVFFQGEALVPSDTNGREDVYEYEGGQVYLISSGTSLSGSFLVGESESGDDVFFRSRQQLVPQDTEEEGQVIYDARVDGGLAAASSPPPCATADSCRTSASPQPSIYGAPSSQTFSGAGNLTPSAEVGPKSKAKPKRPKGKVKPKKQKVCSHNVHKRARCASQMRRAATKAKSHKGGK